MLGRHGIVALSTVVAALLAAARGRAALLKGRRPPRARPRGTGPGRAPSRRSRPVGYLNAHLWACACLRLTAVALVSVVGVAHVDRSAVRLEHGAARG